jgi:purine-cytosine permease-like protein
MAEQAGFKINENERQSWLSLTAIMGLGAASAIAAGQCDITQILVSLGLPAIGLNAVLAKVIPVKA